MMLITICKKFFSGTIYRKMYTILCSDLICLVKPVSVLYIYEPSCHLPCVAGQNPRMDYSAWYLSFSEVKAWDHYACIDSKPCDLDGQIYSVSKLSMKANITDLIRFVQQGHPCNAQNISECNIYLFLEQRSYYSYCANWQTTSNWGVFWHEYKQEIIAWAGSFRLSKYIEN